MTESRNSEHFSQHLAGLVNSSTSVATFMRGAFDFLMGANSCCNCYLALYDPEYKTFSFPFGHGKQEFIEPCTLKSINSPLKKVVEDGSALTLNAEEYRSFCADGSKVTFPPEVWTALPLFKGSEVFAILVCYAEDASQVKDMQLAQNKLTSVSEVLTPFLQTRLRLDILEESEKKFRRFVETSIDITFQITSNGKVDYVSSNIQTRFGIDPKSLIGRHFSSLITRDQVPQVEEALLSILDGNSIKNMPVYIERSAGETIPMETSASPLIDDGSIIGVQGSIRDISERNKAQQEIERLAFFPLANPMPVVEVDLNGVPSYINPAGIQLLERMNLDVSNVAQILPKTFKADIKTARSAQGKVPSREVSLEGLHLLWTAFFLENQNLLHFYATDITNLKNTEAELISAKERALQNEEVKTLFLANMSHEIRTPLNSILGFTELIEDEVKDKVDENLETYFETIYMSGKRLWQTVHHILDISQIETGTFELKKQNIDLGKLITELASSFRSAARAKKIDLQVEINQADMHIISDEYCATQAITNLIDNAIKYTNEGYVRLTGEVVDDVIKITIADSGIGMSQDYQEHMFNLFSQESTGYTKNFQGMGLGLALAHRYLTLINGKIHFESEQEVGSKFTIFLPGHPSDDIKIMADVTHPEEVSKLDLSGTERLNILVVEDDPNSQKLASFTLSEDYDLHFAESVAESKKMLVSHDIQMILLDLSLRGDEDGLDLARFLRADERWHKLPIVALTAHAFTSDRDRCMEAGCNDFMTKPFRLADLKKTIQNLI